MLINEIKIKILQNYQNFTIKIKTTLIFKIVKCQKRERIQNRKIKQNHQGLDSMIAFYIFLSGLDKK